MKLNIDLGQCSFAGSDIGWRSGLVAAVGRPEPDYAGARRSSLTRSVAGSWWRYEHLSSAGAGTLVWRKRWTAHTKFGAQRSRAARCCGTLRSQLAAPRCLARLSTKVAGLRRRPRQQKRLSVTKTHHTMGSVAITAYNSCPPPRARSSMATSQHLAGARSTSRNRRKQVKIRDHKHAGSPACDGPQNRYVGWQSHLLDDRHYAAARGEQLLWTPNRGQRRPEQRLDGSRPTKLISMPIKVDTAIVP